MTAKQTGSPEELLRYLEELSGRTLQTREDIRKYVSDRAGTVREGLLLLVTTFAFLQYYFLDVMVQIEQLPHMVVFVPSAQRLQTMLQLLPGFA
jgi:hypothetical protein